MRMGSNRWLRNSLVYLLIIIGVIVIFYTLIPAFGSSNDIPLTEVVAKAQNHEISEIIVEGDKLTVIPIVTGGAGGTQFASRINGRTDIMQVLAENDVETGPGGVQVTFKGSGWIGQLPGVDAQLPAAHFLWRPDPLHDATGPGQQQPDPELRAQSCPHDALQSAHRNLCRRGRR